MEGLQAHAVTAIEKQFAARGQHRPGAPLHQGPPSREARQDRLQMLASQPAGR
jgi:hypothetical protein